MMLPMYLVGGFLVFVYYYWWQVLLVLFAMAAVVSAIEWVCTAVGNQIYAWNRQYHKRKHEENLARWRKR